jgi:hypothetical protein
LQPKLDPAIEAVDRMLEGDRQAPREEKPTIRFRKRKARRCFRQRTQELGPGRRSKT